MVKSGLRSASLLDWVFRFFGLVNISIFVALSWWWWRPDIVPVQTTPDVALGLHLQLFEIFVSVVGLVLGVMGFVGYQTIRQTAERKAEDAVKQFLAAQKEPKSSPDHVTVVSVASVETKEDL